MVQLVDYHLEAVHNTAARDIQHVVDTLILKGAEQGSGENEKGESEESESEESESQVSNSLEDDTIAYTGQSHAPTLTPSSCTSTSASSTLLPKVYSGWRRADGTIHAK